MWYGWYGVEWNGMDEGWMRQFKIFCGADLAACFTWGLWCACAVMMCVAYLVSPCFGKGFVLVWYVASASVPLFTISIVGLLTGSAHCVGWDSSRTLFCWVGSLWWWVSRSKPKEVSIDALTSFLIHIGSWQTMATTANGRF